MTPTRTVLLSLGNCIHTVELSDRSLPGSGPVLALVEKLRGQPLTFDRLAGTFRTALPELAEGACTLELLALRAEGSLGVHLTLRVGMDRPEYGDPNGRWGTDLTLYDVEEYPPCPTGYWYDFGGPVKSEGRELDPKEMERSMKYLVNKALQVPPERPYGLRLGVTKRP